MKPAMTKDELVESTLQLTDKAFRDLFPILPKEWLSLDLTMPQLKVVLLLFTNGPERMSTIASALGVSLATATGVVDRLVEKDMVTREGDPNDRRIVLIRLSGKGEKLIAGLWQLARGNIEALLRALDQRKLQLLNEALRALLEAGEVVKRELQSNTTTK